MLSIVVICCILSGFIGLAVGSVIGSSTVGEEMEREAIKSGHAFYVANKDGDPAFTWLPPCVPKEKP